jgi:hypothetical protein
MNEPKKRGGQPGNTNAQKTGMHGERIKDLKRRIRAFYIYVDDALDRAEALTGVRNRTRKRRRKR